MMVFVWCALGVLGIFAAFLLRHLLLVSEAADNLRKRLDDVERRLENVDIP
jgi:hypothetical protein